MKFLAKYCYFVRDPIRAQNSIHVPLAFQCVLIHHSDIV